MRTLPLLALPLALFALHGCGGGPEDPAGGGGGEVDDNEVVSIASGGAASDGNSDSVSVSRNDRYLVFATGATNLVTAADLNGVSDVIRHDRDTGINIRISTTASGTEANGGSTFGISDINGTYVAFQSTAANLTLISETGADSDVFVKSVTNDVVTRAQSSGQEPNGESFLLDMTPDGRYVLIASRADNLMGSGSAAADFDSNGKMDIYRWDRSSPSLPLVPVSVSDADLVAAGPAAGWEGSTEGQISDNGLVVVFSSDASNLITNDTNGKRDIFIRTMNEVTPTTGTTMIVSLGNDGSLSNGDSSSPTMSSDGERVAFASLASNLLLPTIPADPGDVLPDIFVRTRGILTASASTVRVSVASDGTPATAASSEPRISRNGAVVSFTTTANLLVLPATDANGFADIYAHTLDGSITRRVSLSTTAGDADAASARSWVNSDGTFVVFESGATNLVTTPTNAFKDIFIAPVTPSGPG